MGGCPPGSAGVPPAQHWQSLARLLDPDRPATAPGLCFSRTHAVPAGTVDGCAIAGKLSDNPRERMRAGRPRSRVGRPDGAVERIRGATSLKADGRLLGNSRLSASPAPAVPGGSYESETIGNRSSLRNLGIPSRLTSTPSWPFVVLRGPSWISLFLLSFSFVSGPFLSVPKGGQTPGT